MRRINQFERTDRDITEALLKVMERKSLEKISVQDILDEAMVNRSTFYQHFQDKYAVLERMQEKYVSGMTERINKIAQSGEWNLEKVRTSLCDYLSQNRSQMKRILSVRSENLNLQERMKQLFVSYLRMAQTSLNELEMDILAGMTVSFFIHFITNDMEETELADLMMKAWLDMSAFFFRVEDVPDAKSRFLTLISELHHAK